MKKYNVYSLKVVGIKKDIKNYYFICEYNDLSDTYTEIFTNNKLKVEDIAYVEPLSNYYSLLEICNYKTGKALRLDKNDLLKKCLDINILKQNQAHTNEKSNTQEKHNLNKKILKKVK